MARYLREWRSTAALILLYAGAAAGETTPVDVHTLDDTVYYGGPLSGAGLAQLKKHYEETAQTIVWLAINSSGGEVNAAMDFGEWVFEHQLNVRIADRCLSACANYIFPAGRVKVIEAGAVVAWHGSAIQTPQRSETEVAAVIERQIMPQTDPAERAAVRAKLLRETLEYLDRARARQSAFFARIGVDERITTIGENRTGVDDFWFLSVASMARFGIDLVVAPADYAATDTSRFGAGAVRFIDLNPKQLE